MRDELGLDPFCRPRDSAETARRCRIMKRRLTVVVLPTLFIIALHGAASASGTLIPRDPRIVPPPGRSVFSVKSQHAGVDINRQVASTTLEQVFKNNTARVLEATYLFPIPEDVSISSFSMWMNGKEVKGEIVDANKARRIYEDIVRRTRDPGLLEYVGQDLFQARVYPIAKHGEVRIKIVYDELLKYDAGLISYHYPLKADQYGFGNIGELSVSVDIRSDVPIKNVYSPSHEIDWKKSRRKASCSFEERDVKPDRDFLLYYAVSEEDMGLSMLTHRIDGEDGYFMLLLSPGTLDNPERVLPKDIVFVIDRSGSMKGEKIEQAKASLKFCIENLNGGDRFNIVTFATGADKFRRKLVTATRTIKAQAVDFVEQIEARGGTDINEALLQALDIPDSDYPQMIVFLTDGLPTVGIRDYQEILENLKQANPHRMRIFSFGVGYDVNTHLLDRMSEDHRGIVEYIKPEEDIETKISGFYTKVKSPVLSDVELNLGDLGIKEIYPHHLPDVFEGSQLVVLGRYEGRGHSKIELCGHVGDDRREFIYEGNFTRREAGHGFIPRLWATRKIGYLFSEIKMNGESPELVDEITKLSKEHGIITPYTSYLVLEEGDRVRMSSGALRDLPPSMPRTPVNVVRDYKVRGGKRAETSMEVMGEVPLPSDASGEAASDMSQHISKSKRQDVIDRTDASRFKYVDGKTFVKTDEGWLDIDHPHGGDAIEITYLSEEYFELLKKYPDVKKYLALGDRVTFVHDGTSYRIIKPPEDEGKHKKSGEGGKK
jgi:Ca-activated chloride channel family protein